MEVFESFLAVYGTTFGMMVLTGLCIALFVELTVKKSFDWLAKKMEGKEKIMAVLSALKPLLIQAAVWTLCVWFLHLLVDDLPFPGSHALYPIWLCSEYVIQYIFSCIGFKGIQDWLETRRNRKPETKEILNPTSVKGIYRDKDGNLVNSKGIPVEVI